MPREQDRRREQHGVEGEVARRDAGVRRRRTAGSRRSGAGRPGRDGAAPTGSNTTASTTSERDARDERPRARGRPRSRAPPRRRGRPRGARRRASRTRVVGHDAGGRRGTARQAIASSARDERDVDEEDRAPASGRDEQSAEQGAEPGRERDRAADDAEGAAAARSAGTSSRIRPAPFGKTTAPETAWATRKPIRNGEARRQRRAERRQPEDGQAAEHEPAAGRGGRRACPQRAGRRRARAGTR